MTPHKTGDRSTATGKFISIVLLDNSIETMRGATLLVDDAKADHAILNVKVLLA